MTDQPGWFERSVYDSLTILLRPERMKLHLQSFGEELVLLSQLEPNEIKFS